MSFSHSKTCLAKIHEFPRDEEGSRRCVRLGDIQPSLAACGHRWPALWCMVLWRQQGDFVLVSALPGKTGRKEAPTSSLVEKAMTGSNAPSTI